MDSQVPSDSVGVKILIKGYFSLLKFSEVGIREKMRNDSKPAHACCHYNGRSQLVKNSKI